MVSLDTAERALLTSEQRLTNALLSLGWLVGATKSYSFLDELVKRPRLRGELDAVYYQKIHEEDDLYRQNNWLVSEVDNIMAANPKTIVELGCGNGAFVKAVAQRVNHVIAVDWAKSPLLDQLPDNATFLQADILRDGLPAADIVCSADVMEHFEPDEIAPLLTKIKNCAPLQYHVISCYDDGHSHLTVMPPGGWLAAFRQLDANFHLAHVGIRRDDPEQIVCTITNINSADRKTEFSVEHQKQVAAAEGNSLEVKGG